MQNLHSFVGDHARIRFTPTPVANILEKPEAPASIAQALDEWPDRKNGWQQSPRDWREQVFYFFLVDRFSDEFSLESGSGGPPYRPPLKRTDLRSSGRVQGDEWELWARSGMQRFQGGTIRGATSRLGYLQDLGVTAIWLGAVLKQRCDVRVDEHYCDTYHGYKIQNFLDVDPRFGSRADLVEFVAAAHALDMFVILDAVVNHTAQNFFYRVDGQAQLTGPYLTNGRYESAGWRGRDGNPMEIGNELGPDDGVWPRELQDLSLYHRRGQPIGKQEKTLYDSPDDKSRVWWRLCDHDDRDLSLGSGYTEGPDTATHEWTGLRLLTTCWRYWIALTDCDGFRVDTFKHITQAQARRFSEDCKNYAETLGKTNFAIFAEVGGGDRYMDPIQKDMGDAVDAMIDTGDLRKLTRQIVAGDPSTDVNRYFQLASQAGDPGQTKLTSLDDHDDLGAATWGSKEYRVARLPLDASAMQLPADPRSVDDYFWSLAVVPGAAMILFTPGIPCLYYGTEQAMAGPAMAHPETLPGWADGNWHDRYLREAMFGPEHPRASGAAGRPSGEQPGLFDEKLPGFGPFGTVGHHLFDHQSPTFRRLALLIEARRKYASLWAGVLSRAGVGELPVGVTNPTAVLAWVMAKDETMLVVVNTDPVRRLSPAIFLNGALCRDATAARIVASTAAVDDLSPGLVVGATLGFTLANDDSVWIVVPNLPPSEVVVIQLAAAGDV